MATSNITAAFPYKIDTVWNVITSVENYTWRSDLSKTEVLNENQFIEYTKEGYATTFTTTVKNKYMRWEFDMENRNMKGHWTGVFHIKSGEETEIEITEEVTAKKVFMKPFIKFYLKKQQAQFIADLRKALLTL